MNRPPVPTGVVFSEDQRFIRGWLIWLVVLPIAVCVWAFVQQLILGKPFGNNPASDAILIVVVLAVGILFPAFLLSLVLRTWVTSAELRFQYWPLNLSPHRISFDSIRSVEALTFRPLQDSYGWGIRTGKDGKYYTVSGNRGVKITLADGKAIVLGSQRADQLAAAIRAYARPSASSSATSRT